jgi:hypothetical protein
VSECLVATMSAVSPCCVSGCGSSSAVILEMSNNVDWTADQQANVHSYNVVLALMVRPIKHNNSNTTQQSILAATLRTSVLSLTFAPAFIRACTVAG